MKILVIGRQGQVARSLAGAVLPAGTRLALRGRPEADLTMPGTLQAVLDELSPDVVVNAAAYTAVDQAEQEPDTAAAINAAGAGELARLCGAAGVPLIHISTDYVFDGTKREAYREDDPVAPLGVYGATKLEGERLVAESTARHIILRTSWVHSPYGKNFVKTMLRLAETRDELGVVDDQHGCPTYAPDLADAIIGVAMSLQAAGSAETRWGIYHAAGAGETTWCGLARAVFEGAQRRGLPAATVRGIATADYPTPAERPQNSRLDCSKLSDAFGMSLPSWQSGVERCVAALAEPRGEAGND